MFMFYIEPSIVWTYDTYALGYQLLGFELNGLIFVFGFNL